MNETLLDVYPDDSYAFKENTPQNIQTLFRGIQALRG